MPITFSALAFAAGLGIFACAQDASDLGAGSDPTTDVDASTDPGADTGTKPDTSTPPPPPPPTPPPPPSDAAPPPDDASQDAGPPPDAAPLPNGDCDVNDPIGKFVYPAEFANGFFKGTLTPCPCNATQCCYSGACVGR